MAFSDRIAVELSGGCQCGAMRYHATARKDNAHICHCRMCQKAVGGFFAALVGIPLDSFRWTRGEPAAFRSSAHVERGFCARCGTPLFYRRDDPPAIAVTIGSLDHPERVPPIVQVGNEGRLPYARELAALPGNETTEQTDGVAAVAAIAASNRQHPDHDTETWPPRSS